MSLNLNHSGLSFGTSKLRLLIVVIAFLLMISFGSLSAGAQQITPQVRATKFVINRWGYNSTKGGPDIVVNVGDTARITIINNDTINHNWGVDVLSPASFNVRTPTIRGVGNTTSVEFVAGIPGVFKYYCNAGAQHRRLGLEGNLVVNTIAPPPTDVSGRVKALEDQVSSLLSLTNQVKGIDDQIKSLSSSVTNLAAEQSTLKTSLSSITNFASEQTALKAAVDSASSQGALLMGLSGIATLLGIIALGIAVTVARKKSS